MIVETVKTARVSARSHALLELLDQHLPTIEEKTVVVITSKIVALCEGRVAPLDGVDKEALIQSEADYYMPLEFGKYGFHFTITRNTLISMAGIDESNADGMYVLWPANPQKTANEVRKYLVQRFGLKDIGVMITDSTCMPPMRAGTVGIMLAHSGFSAVADNTGTADLFGRTFQFSKSGVGSGIAAAANLVMGEGKEQTPIALVKDIPFVTFQRRNPSEAEIKQAYFAPEDDLYGPFITSVAWQPGGAGATRAAA
ncbi:MAG TPA: coenzyme F420-0:L-glutamate ligase [Candidatus Saccharimonadales bacterium]|nr:coenzyme F420-0:L-glutamate ligase [Candidatus Saccharimonadales bacterium]